MPNETVRATLTSMLTKYAAERAEILGKGQDCRLMLGDAEANLKRRKKLTDGRFRKTISLSTRCVN